MKQLAILAAALTIAAGQTCIGRVSSGGPDSFGYRYLDSDTTCPGSPFFRWVDVKGMGTKITGLGDDNYVGPFGIGFEFPYYGYRVSTAYIGADGYVTFTHAGVPGLPPNPIPDTSEPNNTVAPLLSDLDCSAGGAVWYWTSPDSDSFIIQYDSIRFWSTGGNNTFEIVLSRPDSTITIQYREQSGAPFGDWAPEHNQTGIEDSTGAVGLNYLSGTLPPQNMIHDSLAVRFIPPDSTLPWINDAATRDRRGAMSFATVVRCLPTGLAVFDAMGRRVSAPRSGICFVRGAVRGAGAGGRTRKVIIQ